MRATRQAVAARRRPGIVCVAAVAALLGACGGKPGGAPEGPSVDPSLAGVYSGVFPCENCEGIGVTLWLRPDGRFFIEQRYPEGDGQAAFDAYNLGRWDWSRRDRLISLRGAGPVRVYSNENRNGTLFLQTASRLEHRLEREAGFREFTATIPLSGMVGRRDGRTVFSECATGFVAPLATGGDYRRFRHQYRSVEGSGSPVYVEFDGHFAWSADGAPAEVTIDRFATVRADGGC
jgi:copper homeostasis protein (lipoprotein)